MPRSHVLGGFTDPNFIREVKEVMLRLEDRLNLPGDHTGKDSLGGGKSRVKRADM